MKILISNDDGFDSVGIIELAKLLAKNHQVYIFAPSINKSASSSSLTIDKSIKIEKINNTTYKINGTPSDCVHLALRGFFDFNFDLVITGINFGANMGDDVIYSGTVAGAIEARHLGLPSIAFSLATKIITPLASNNANKHNFKTAARIAVDIVEKIKTSQLNSDTILNVNIPDVAFDKIQGFHATRLGKRHASGNIKACSIDNCFYLGENGTEDDNGIGTDFYAINNKFISITPLHIDLTRYSEIEKIANWLIK